jgi:hypothetical protein
VVQFVAALVFLAVALVEVDQAVQEYLEMVHEELVVKE